MGMDSSLSRRAVRVNALLLAVGLFAVPTAAQPAGRVALVVGNSAYAAIGTLPNPGNDAADMAAALRRLGFEVTTALDADRGELNDALRAFTRQSAGADVSLVFYAGHGIEMDGVNYSSSRSHVQPLPCRFRARLPHYANDRGRSFAPLGLLLFRNRSEPTRVQFVGAQRRDHRQAASVQTAPDRWSWISAW